MSSKVQTLREGGNRLYGASGKRGQKGSQKEQMESMADDAATYKYTGQILYCLKSVSTVGRCVKFIGSGGIDLLYVFVRLFRLRGFENLEWCRCIWMGQHVLTFMRVGT